MNSIAQRGRQDSQPRNDSKPMSQFGDAPPQLSSLPFLPYAGSIHGSEYGAPAAMMPGFPHAPSMSMYGMGMPTAPHTSMFGMPTGSGSQVGTPGGLGAQQRPMSTFSFATSVNPFAGPSMNPNPSDDELFNALRMYLSTQDLMTVTKK